MCVCIYTGIYTGIHAGKESVCDAEDLALIPEMERSPGERKDYPLQYSGLKNSMDSIVHGVSKSQTRHSSGCAVLSCSVMSDSLQPHGL